MIFTVIQVLLLVLFPFAAQWLAKKHKVFEWISPVVLCYIFGILLAHQPFLHLKSSLSKNLMSGAVVLALPMLLFSSDFMGWLKLAKSTLIAFFVFVTSVAIGSIATFFLIGSKIKEASKISGMLMGVFTGGTLNLNAIAIALKTDETMITLTNTGEVILGGLWLLVLMTIAQRVLLKFLPAFQFDEDQQHTEEALAEREASEEEKTEKITLMHITFCVGLSLACAFVTVGLSMLLFQKLSEAFLLLTLTGFGVLCSFYKPIRHLPGSYETGEYLLLIFCVAIGSLVNFKVMLSSGSWLFLYIFLVMAIAISLHLLVMFFLKIDTDTAIITMTAGIYGPPFIGPVAAALRNRHILLSGMTTASLGIALGNFVGLFLARFLAGFGG